MKKPEIFLNEYTMKAASIVAAACAVISILVLAVTNELTALALFEGAVKAVIAIALYVTFSHFHWHFMRGLMGAMLFALLYQEAFQVLDRLWGATTDFDAYLIMGIQGSLYLAASTMSFMMTIVITFNHFVLEYSNLSNRANMVFNQISILFKIFLYVLLIYINIFLDLPSGQLVSLGIGYLGDLSVIVMLICIESQLDDFKEMRQEMMSTKTEERG